MGFNYAARAKGSTYWIGDPDAAKYIVPGRAGAIN
jgi:hypothetical protein